MNETKLYYLIRRPGDMVRVACDTREEAEKLFEGFNPITVVTEVPTANTGWPYEKKLHEIISQKNVEIKALVACWKDHQKTKFRNDGSHFEADLKMNAVVELCEKGLSQ